MSRMSRGCRRCRERRVRCGGRHPSCRHCIRRDEVCEGYKDEASLIFRHETEKTKADVCSLPFFSLHLSFDARIPGALDPDTARRLQIQRQR
ncbi:hypothetical protein F5Y17DRAFT_434228 [Xylariaceae sp. FL0594]|nr:hypothetical protein F5Y17DRAFT_434228 [Xylariaceae sp. FL0594]